MQEINKEDICEYLNRHREGINYFWGTDYKNGTELYEVINTDWTLEDDLVSATADYLCTNRNDRTLLTLGMAAGLKQCLENRAEK